MIYRFKCTWKYKDGFKWELFYSFPLPIPNRKEAFRRAYRHFYAYDKKSKPFKAELVKIELIDAK